MKARLLKKLRKSVSLCEYGDRFIIDDLKEGSWGAKTFKEALAIYHDRINRRIDGNRLREAKRKQILPTKRPA